MVTPIRAGIGLSDMLPSDLMRRLRPSLVLIAIGAMIIGGWTAYSALTATGLRLPLKLEGGTTVSQSFRVFSTARYDAELEIDRKFSFEQSACLLGVADAPAACAPAFGPPELSWEVTEVGRPVHCERLVTAAHRSGDAMVLPLCQIPLRLGARYVATIRMEGASRTWAATHPRLVISENARAVKDGILFLLIAWVLGLGFGLVGLFKLAAELLAFRRPRKRS